MHENLGHFAAVTVMVVTIVGLPTLCDGRLGDNDVINFNAGDHSLSVNMRYADYLLVEKPELGTFAEEGAFALESIIGDD